MIKFFHPLKSKEIMFSCVWKNFMNMKPYRHVCFSRQWNIYLFVCNNVRHCQTYSDIELWLYGIINGGLWSDCTNFFGCGRQVYTTLTLKSRLWQKSPRNFKIFQYLEIFKKLRNLKATGNTWLSVNSWLFPTFSSPLTAHKPKIWRSVGAHDWYRCQIS